jgi:hypothetical protein
LDFFLEYRWVRGGGVEDGPARRLVVRDGKVVVGAKSGLAVGLGAFDGRLRRYRTFEGGASPRRHNLRDFYPPRSNGTNGLLHTDQGPQPTAGGP